MMPSHLNPLPNLCLAVIARRSYPVHGHPLGSPIKGGPELELEPTPPLHSTYTTPSHWKSPEGAFFPDSTTASP